MFLPCSGLVTDTFQDPRIDPAGALFDQSANRSRKLGGKISFERVVPGFEALTLTAGFDALFDRTEQFLVQTGRTFVRRLPATRDEVVDAERALYWLEVGAQPPEDATDSYPDFAIPVRPPREGFSSGTAGLTEVRRRGPSCCWQL